MDKGSILVVEDDREVADWLFEYLSGKSYRVSTVHRGDEAVDRILKEQPDLVILDGMLPGLDGIEVCRAVRPAFKNGIIMLTALDEEADEVLGLEMGANDYMTKPVRPRALLTRIGKLLAAQSGQPADEGDDRLSFDGLVIDRLNMKVSLHRENINISPHEFEVLWLLAEKAGQVVTREELVRKVRGFDYDGFDRAVDLRISKLRKKLGDNADAPCRIKTVRGKGYLFVRDAG